MNPYSTPPPYPEKEDRTCRNESLNQFRIARKPIQNPRSKTQGVHDHNRPLHVVDRWTPPSRSQADLDLEHSQSQWISSKPNLSVDMRIQAAETKPTTECIKRGSGPSIAADQRPHATAFLDVTPPKSTQSYLVDMRNRDSNTRPKTASAELSQCNSWFRGRSIANFRDSPSQWGPPQPNMIFHTQADARPRTADTRPSTSGRDSKFSTASTVSSFHPCSASTFSTSPADVVVSSNVSSMQKAFQEARHFAGGLISHPIESTKHFSILRHSHGLVFYQGLNTTLAISIFADAPLPPGVTLWLQSKGWTGKTGMRVKALLGCNDSWFNVTPRINIGSGQLKPTDERAWQRDIKKFRKKANGKTESHILRTTAIVQIPLEAQDGYFALVLCLGEKKKILCASPSFRVLSVSTHPHSIRGASLLTMPIEIGAMALGVYIKNTAGRVAGPAISATQNRVQKYLPSGVIEAIAATAYSHSRTSDKAGSTVGYMNDQHLQSKNELHTMGAPAETGIGSPNVEWDHYQKPNYPVHFFAESELTRTEHSLMPCLRLRGVSDTVGKRLHGYYFGWARFVTSAKKPKELDTEDWQEVLISALSVDVSQHVLVSITEASNISVLVQFIQDSDDILPQKNRLEIKVMGFIRHDEPIQRKYLSKGLQAVDNAAIQAAIAVYWNDISIARSFLYHPLWSPESLSRKIGEAQLEGQGRFQVTKSTVANSSVTIQRHIDRVPLEKLGIRTEVDRTKDTSISANGFWVLR
jgi:hypothetical protein